MNKKIEQKNWIKNWTATFQGPELVWNYSRIDGHTLKHISGHAQQQVLSLISQIYDSSTC